MPSSQTCPALARAPDPLYAYAMPDAPADPAPAPPHRLALAAALLAGAVIGLGAFTFFYGQGASYLSTDPEACINCHIMQDQFDSWIQSSHRPVAGCADCHLPHALVPKYIAKADNGLMHSVAFTLQNFPEPIRIKARNYRIVQDNCVQCHAELVHELLRATVDGSAVECIHCHAAVGHAGRSSSGALRRR
jgi:cytochrome c nitrite reductase small subunit